MFAPVYRHLDTPSTFLGLAFPTEWLAVLGAGWVGTALGAPNIGAGAALGIYGVIRVAAHGRPEGHLQHWLQWRVRQAVSGGRLSAAARSRSPRFPFGAYEWRDQAVEERR